MPKILCRHAREGGHPRKAQRPPIVGPRLREGDEIDMLRGSCTVMAEIFCRHAREGGHPRWAHGGGGRGSSPSRG
ncbi:hypothetical protein X805_30240 [Sphaerotilus natans subsp. natans DSM 6575]|uniref:Uncharacterized protein n=1 Tax=Sphaerotilus natans subsp. natans DSM 6575 TaxID=1286631 RepID=A0A059KJ14_9BURK|nr:hypothetical protein X805_30240 [Sphaerotilus natans subsp. natans DSM 6575]